MTPFPSPWVHCSGFSVPPQLKRIYINSSTEALQDNTLPGEVISLASLVESDYLCSPAGQVLPYLRLPCLERLYVCFVLGSGQVQGCKPGTS